MACRLPNGDKKPSPITKERDSWVPYTLVIVIFISTPEPVVAVDVHIASRAVVTGLMDGFTAKAASGVRAILEIDVKVIVIVVIG